MVCNECGGNMYLDDKDYFRGLILKYWCCEHCQTSCIEKLVGNRTLNQLWHSENDGVKDYIIHSWSNS